MPKKPAMSTKFVYCRTLKWSSIDCIDKRIHSFIHSICWSANVLKTNFGFYFVLGFCVFYFFFFLRRWAKIKSIPSRLALSWPIRLLPGRSLDIESGILTNNNNNQHWKDMTKMHITLNGWSVKTKVEKTMPTIVRELGWIFRAIIAMDLSFFGRENTKVKSISLNIFAIALHEHYVMTCRFSISFIECFSSVCARTDFWSEITGLPKKKCSLWKIDIHSQTDFVVILSPIFSFRHLSSAGRYEKAAYIAASSHLHSIEKMSPVCMQSYKLPLHSRSTCGFIKTEL